MSKDFEEKVLKKLSELDKKVSRIDVIEEKLSEIDEIKEKVSRIDVIEEKLSEIDEIKEKVSRIDTIEEKLSEIDEIKEKVSKIDIIEKTVLLNSKKIDYLDDKIKRIGNSLILIENKLNDDLKAIHEGHILNTDLRLEDRERINSLEKNDFDHAVRISNLEFAVEKQSKKIKS